jgi:broad specificity phosphatase PhoE
VTTTIALVRHGETDWNRERRFQGHTDIPLNDAGLAQVQKLADQLDGQAFTIAYASPLKRAAQTAEILAARLGIEVQHDAGLKEVDVGAWSGLTVPEVELRYPDGYSRWHDWRVEGWDDGEAYEELSGRVVAALQDIGARHVGGKVLAVTHGGPIRAAIAAARGLTLDEAHSTIGPLANCAVVRVAVRDGELEAVD